ncbi:MAG: hypothetical protein HZB23_00710 [Deltaproteobacteria bacterium]|nr:hypothetical protein [Deltaproteobacteria bacterium]
MCKTRSWKRVICLLVVAFFLLQTAACGYFVYPERRGQTRGRVDPAVAIMDGVCLILFVVPGIIAFAVDFSSGTIYLPGGRSSLDNDKIAVVMADPKNMSDEALERIIHEQTGLAVELDNASMKTLGSETPNQIERVLSDLEKSGYAG